ncbi:MAG: xylulokinase [Ahrensia sp.]|nr:xylulokinase [Ahrensia sp.]
MYLGIDIGTSAVKSLIMDENGNVVETASSPLQSSSPHAGWSEQHPDIWWKATLDCAANLRAENSQAWSAIRAIGLSGQMHGAVLLGRKKVPLRAAILWNDGRSDAECVKMAEALPQIGQIAGVPPMPGFTAPKLLWIARHEPQTHRRIAHILLPKDYVRLKMTGELATDMADAAGTMWLDQKNRTWSQEICGASATEPSWLPGLLEGTQVSGSLTADAAQQLGLSQSVLVAAGGGDAAAGAMGIGAVNHGDAFISLGTSGQFFIANDSYRPNPESAIHAYAHCVPDRWFQMAAMLNGASPMSWFASVSNGEIGALLTDAQRADTDRTPLFLPYLTGERTPHNDAKIRASFHGLEPSTDRGQMMCSVVDAIAYSFCDARDALAQAGTEITAPAAIGGGARSDFVLQNMADALAMAITRYADAETGPALGAARLAVLATGDASVAAVAKKPKTDVVFEPNDEQFGRHAERLARYREIYTALKPLTG